MEVKDPVEKWVVDTGIPLAVRDDAGFPAKESELRALGFKIWTGNTWDLVRAYPYLNLRQTLSGEFTPEEKRDIEEIHKTHRSGGGALKWTGGETKSVFIQGGESRDWWQEEQEYKKLLFVSASDQPQRTAITSGWTYVGESATVAESNLGRFSVFDSNALGFEGESLTSTETRLDPSVGPTLPPCPGRKGGRRTLGWADIKSFRGGTRGTEGGKHTQAMNNVSAGTAAAAAGYRDIRGIGDPHNPSSTKKANYQWLHLFAYGLGGRDGSNPDEPGNLVVGTSMANGVMELVEALIAEALQEGAVLVLDVRVDMIDTAYHIPGKISYSIWNNRSGWNTIHYEFDPMSTWPSYSGDKRFTREFFRASLGL
jgi:hypothetical protein